MNHVNVVQPPEFQTDNDYTSDRGTLFSTIWIHGSPDALSTSNKRVGFSIFLLRSTYTIDRDRPATTQGEEHVELHCVAVLLNSYNIAQFLNHFTLSMYRSSEQEASISLKAPYLDSLHDKIPACGQWIVVKRVTSFGSAMVEVTVKAEAEMAVTGADVDALVTAAQEIGVLGGPLPVLQR